MTRRGLGRGLDALISSTDQGATSAPPGGGVREVDVGLLAPNPRQPRRHIDEAELAELASSIQTHGLIQPIVATARSGEPGYTIVAGERRWRAARAAGLTTVPVILRQVDDRDLLTLAIVENVQRSDLNPIEAAEGYHHLMEESGLTQAEVAALIGKSRVAVANTVRLLALPADLQSMIVDGRLSEGHARALLALPDAGAQRRLAMEAVDHGWPVRKVEAEARAASRVIGRPRAGEARIQADDTASVDANTRAAERDMEAALGTRVEIRRRGTGGQIVLHFFSEEELAALYDRLVQDR